MVTIPKLPSPSLRRRIGEGGGARRWLLQNGGELAIRVVGYPCFWYPTSCELLIRPEPQKASAGANGRASVEGSSLAILLSFETEGVAIMPSLSLWPELLSSLASAEERASRVPRRSLFSPVRWLLALPEGR